MSDDEKIVDFHQYLTELSKVSPRDDIRRYIVKKMVEMIKTDNLPALKEFRFNTGIRFDNFIN